MRSHFVALVVTLSCGGTLAAQDVMEAQAERVVVGPATRGVPCVALSRNEPMSRARPEGVAEQEIADPWFTKIRVFGTELVATVAGSAPGKDLNMIAVDVDGDGRFSEAERTSVDFRVRDRRGVAYHSAKSDVMSIERDGKKAHVFFRYQRVGDDDPKLQITYGDQLHGTIEYGAEERVIAILDSNHDGDFDDPEDLWTLGRKVGRRVNQYALHALAEHRFEAGWDLALDRDGEKLRLTITDAEAPRPQDLSSHRERIERLWSDRFDKEQAKFVAAREVDTDRPKASTPIAWRYCTFEEGLELAKQAGKPLFVDVLAFWCVWCYRLDYYTYVDREVADYMNANFVPVKIVQEQDLVGDYARLREKLEARGIPSMGVFDADGRVLHKIGGWKKPVDFLAELKKAASGD